MGKLSRQSTKYTPDNIALRSIYQFYFFGLGLTLMVLAIIALSSFSDSMKNYNYMMDNWRRNPIIDIRISTDTCRDNELLLNSYNWPGTKDGCDCRRYRQLQDSEHLRSYGYDNKIYTNHACNYSQELYGCESIYSQDSRDFNMFPDPSSTQGFQLCATVESGNSFASNPPIGDCLDGELKCGDHEDYFYCTKQKKCPIFKIGLNTDKFQLNIERLSINSNSALWISRENNTAMPMVEIRVGEGNGICIFNDDRPITSGRTDYILMNEQKNDCSKDHRFIDFAKTDEINFYKYNKALDLKDKLRSYDISGSYEWGMYQRGYILWKQKCRGQQMQDFIDQEQILDEIGGHQSDLLVISIILFIILSIIMSIVAFANICGYDWPCIKGRGSEESNYIFIIEIVFKVVLQLTDAIIILISFATVNQEINFLTKLIDQECTDEISQGHITELRDVIQERIYGYNLGQLILFIVSTTIDIFIIGYLVINYCIKKNKKDHKFEQSQCDPQMQNGQPGPIQINNYNDKPVDYQQPNNQPYIDNNNQGNYGYQQNQDIPYQPVQQPYQQPSPYQQPQPYPYQQPQYQQPQPQQQYGGQQYQQYPPQQYPGQQQNQGVDNPMA